MTCVECGDLSPLSPLSAYDLVFIQTYLAERAKIRQAELEIQLDIRFLLTRLSYALTGSEGMNFLPSHVAEMGRTWEKNHPGGG